MTANRQDTAREAALKAGKLLVDLFDPQGSSGELKSDKTLVTQADREADRLVQTLISEAHPEDGVLSEERSTVFPDTEHAWVVDPLDGTVNFSHGLMYWGVSIAHLKDGIPQDGAIYFPLLEELYTASRGEGAFLNGTALAVQSAPEQDLFPVFVHCSRMHERYTVKTRFKKRSLGAAAYHICLIARSTAALALESTPRIWDIAAGWLIVQEAGGVIHTLNGEEPFPAQPGMDYARKPYGVLAAGSEEIWREAFSRITPKLDPYPEEEK